MGAIRAFGDPLLRAGFGDALKPYVGDDLLRNAVDPLMRALEGLTSALPSEGLQDMWEKLAEPGSAEAVRQGLDSTREALSQLSELSVAQNNPAFAELVEIAVEEVDDLNAGQATVLARLESIDTSLKAVASSSNDARRSERYQAAWEKASFVLNLLIFVVMVLPYLQPSTQTDTASIPPEAPGEAREPAQLDIDVVILQLLHELRQVEEHRPRLVREAPVRIEPHGRAREQCRLEAGAAVSVVQGSGAWVLVQLEPGLSSLGHDTGWVHRKHLSRP